jgi:endonuclease/exonuclease/phosphatase (EEP) superfamily protein YafD
VSFVSVSLELRVPLVNPLTVYVNSSGKERLVLDLRHVNTFVDKQKVKFEGANEALAFANNSKYIFFNKVQRCMCFSCTVILTI